MGVAGFFPSPGGPGSAPGPVLDRDEVDRALARLGAEHEAIETSLLALQDHAGRRLLEGAELAGVTKDRWAATEQSITVLWTYFDAYAKALEEARTLRSRRRWPSQDDLAELTDVLRGRGVTLASTAAQLPAALRGPAGLTERFSLEELVTRMNELYARSLDMIVASDSVWSALPARIDLLAAELARTRSLAHSVGVRPGEHPAGDDLESITQELAALRAGVISDPWPTGFPRRAVLPRAAGVPTPGATTGRPAPWRRSAARSTRYSPSARTPSSVCCDCGTY